MSDTLNKFAKIKLMLKMAKQAYFDKALTKSEYLLLIDSIEADYMQIVNQLEYREASDLLESYILKLS